MSFTCTRCFKRDLPVPDLHGLSADAMIIVCSNWKCDDCLDELEEAGPSPESPAKEDRP